MIRYEFAEDEQNAAESVEYQRPNENLMEFIGGEQNKHWEMDHQMNSYQTVFIILNIFWYLSLIPPHQRSTLFYKYGACG